MTRAGILAAALAALTALAVPAAAHADPADAPGLTSAAIDAYVERQLDASGVPGLSIVVTHDDRTVYASGYGRDSEGAAITADSPMRIASLSKAFTATAVLELVEAQRIRLDGTLAEQLPEFTMADPRYASITVRELLNQTSGIGGDGLDPVDIDGIPTLAEYVPALAGAYLVADPGTHFEYCDVNYDLLARLVETVAGQPFPEYMTEHVFVPLGMTATAINGPAPEGEIESFGHWAAAEEPPDGPDVGGAGHITTTAADMGRWLVNQDGRGPQLIGPDSLRLMHTAVRGGYGMGWWVETADDGAELLTHMGSLYTYSAHTTLIPGTGYGFAVMANSVAVYDEPYEVLQGLIALAGDDPPRVDRSLWTIEWTLGACTALAAAGGAWGVARSRRWADRRRGRPAWRLALGLAPYGIPAAALVAYPLAVQAYLHRELTWRELYYRAPSVVFLLAAAVLSATAVAAARVVRWRGRRARTGAADG